MRRVLTAITAATAVAGTLDLLSAFVFGGMGGATPTRVLHTVASGPFGPAMFDGGITAALIGLGVHFAIMAVMVAMFVNGAVRLPALTKRPILYGAMYGVGLYLFMYWLVLPARWPDLFPRSDWWSVGNALFSHVVCVGIPLALVSARILRR